MRRNFLLAFGSVWVALGILEIALRLFNPEVSKVPEKPRAHWVSVPERVWTEYHPALGWYHQKNKDAKLLLNGRETQVHTNSMGFRGRREYERKKPRGVTRLIALGDSFPFGFGVEDHQTYSAILESQDANLEVLNLGVPGYGLDQMLIAYRLIGSQFEADYVLIGVFPEDFWRCTRAFADSGHAKPYFSLSAEGKLWLHNNPVPRPFELKTNQFPEILPSGPVRKILQKSLLYRAVQRGLIRLGKNLRLIDPDQTPEWILGKAVLRELLQEIRKDGAQPVLLILPPERWVRDPRKTSLRKSLLRFMKQEKILGIDMTPRFYEAIQAEGLTSYYFEEEWHWTPKGQELAATLIKEYLMS